MVSQDTSLADSNQATAKEVSEQTALMKEQRRIAREIAKNNRKVKRARRRAGKAKAKAAARQTGYTGPIIFLNGKPYRVEYVSRPESVVGQRNIQPPSRNAAPSGAPKYLKASSVGLPIVRILQGPPDDTYYAVARMNSGTHGYVWGRGYNPYTGEWASGSYELTEADVMERSRGMVVVVDNGNGTAVTKSSNVRRTNAKAKRKTAAPKKPQASKSKSGTTYSKDIIEANRRHILSFYTQEEFVDEVRNQMKGGKSAYQAIDRMVLGGDFLAWNDDIRQYLSSIGVKGSRKYSNDETWNLYRHLLARDGSKLYETLTQKPKSAQRTGKASGSKNAKGGSSKKPAAKTSRKASGRSG